jgi:hypothetical protein
VWGNREVRGLNKSEITFPVDGFSELCGLWVVDDVRDYVLCLSEILFSDGGEGGESER